MSADDSEPGPFRSDRRYRVRKDLECFPCHTGKQVFRAGETLDWLESEDSPPYDSVTQHRFRVRGSDQILVWETAQGEDRALWSEFFEELPARPARRPRRAS